MTYIPSRDEVESALAKASSIDPLACEVRRLRELLEAACSAVDATLLGAVMASETERINAKLANVEDIRNELRDHQDRSPVNVDIIVEMLTEALEDEP